MPRGIRVMSNGWLSRVLQAPNWTAPSSDRFIGCLDILCEREALQLIKTADVRRPPSLLLLRLQPESEKMTRERSLDVGEYTISGRSNPDFFFERLTASDEQRGNECEFHF